MSSQERVELRNSNFAETFTRSIRTKYIKNFGEKGAWAYPGIAQIFWVPPIISGTGKATDFKFGHYIHGPSEQKPIKNFGEKGEGVSRDCPNVLGAPYYLRNR